MCGTLDVQMDLSIGAKFSVVSVNKKYLALLLMLALAANLTLQVFFQELS